MAVLAHWRPCAAIVTADMNNRIVATIAAAGAQLVLVGDPAQLPAAGAPLRQIEERAGHVTLADIRAPDSRSTAPPPPP